MSKLALLGVVGVTTMYVIGLQNPPEDIEYIEYEDGSVDIMDPQLGFLEGLGLSLGTQLAVSALARGASKAVGSVVGKTAAKTAASAATKAAGTVVTKAATTVVTKAATEAATTVVTKAATTVVTMAATEAASKAATTVVTKAATEAATTVATKGATTAATKAATTAVAKSASVAAKGAKASTMMSKLKGTPADLIMMIISQILIMVLDLDPENFAKCDNGEFDLNSFPQWAQIMISAIPFLGDIFDLIGNKLCFRGGCAAGEEEFGGLCYKPCAAGFKSDAGAPYNCYKQYPDFEGNGMLHTFLNMTKKMITEMGSIPGGCPAGMVGDAGLCYTPCEAGYKGIGPVCWADTHKVNTVGRIPDKGGCPGGMRDDGTSCWDDLKTTGGGCRGGNTYECGRLRGVFGEDWGPEWCTAPIQCDPVVTTGSGTIKMTLFQRQSCGANEDLIDGLCYNKCPVGTDHVPGAPYDCRTRGDLSKTRPVGTPMVCTGGDEQDGALCYKPKPGYRLLAGTFAQNCPAGSMDIGVACERENYNRGAGMIPLGIRMKPRL